MITPKITKQKLRNRLWQPLVAVSVILLFVSCASTADKIRKAEETAGYVREQISQQNFRIRVNHMYPQRYPSRTVMSEFWMELKDGMLNSYLPYLGQVQSPSPYSIEQGLNFEAEVKNYSEQRNDRKRRTEIMFNAKSQEDTYLYKVYIYDNGSAEIDVHANRRDYIRFSGELE